MRLFRGMGKEPVPFYFWGQRDMRDMTHEQRAMADAALTNKLNVIHHVYVDITGDLIAGALLGQILYWFGADRNGRPRARIVKDGHLWIAKGRADWWDEIRISAKQYDRAAKILKEFGFIEVKTFKFNGNPTSHLRIIPESLNQAIDKWKWQQVSCAGLDGIENQAVVGYSPLGNNDFTNQGITMLTDGATHHNRMGNIDMPKRSTSLTEITTKTTNEITTESTDTIESVISFEDVWSRYPKKVGKEKARQAYIQAIKEGTNPLEILVAVALYRQHAVCSIEHRYIPTGGKWFSEKRWQDDVPSISSKLGFDDGLDYNHRVIELRKQVRAGDLEAVQALLSELPY